MKWTPHVRNNVTSLWTCGRYAIEGNGETEADGDLATYELYDGKTLIDIFPTLREAKTYARGMAYLVREGMTLSATTPTTTRP